ncbi:MAG: hypothetical protein JSS81_13070 [Acidobacteria bacterium]|nr:hypothetical protein [Acidobacteriota bacterium]
MITAVAAAAPAAVRHAANETQHAAQTFSPLHTQTGIHARVLAAEKIELICRSRRLLPVKQPGRIIFGSFESGVDDIYRFFGNRAGLSIRRSFDFSPFETVRDPRQTRQQELSGLARLFGEIIEPFKNPDVAFHAFRAGGIFDRFQSRLVCDQPRIGKFGQRVAQFFFLLIGNETRFFDFSDRLIKNGQLFLSFQHFRLRDAGEGTGVARLGRRQTIQHHCGQQRQQ